MLALVGLGYWGPNLLRNLVQLDALSAAFDVDENKLRKFATDPTYKDVFFDADWEKSLGRQKIKGIVIATPPNTHYSIAKKALKNNRHVLVEKPMTLSVSEAEELVEIADKKNLVLLVGHTFLYSPEIIKLKELIYNKDFGEIYYIYSKRLNLGKIQWPANVVEDLLPHDISIFNYITEDSCVGVRALGYSYVTKNIEEVAFVDCKFKNGIRAHMHLSWLDPLKTRTMVVVGKNQMAVCDSGNKIIELYNKGIDIGIRKNISNIDYAQHLLNYKYGDVVIPYIESYEPLYSECNDFIKCIKMGDKPRADGKIGLEVVKVLCAAQRSVKSDNEWINV